MNRGSSRHAHYQVRSSILGSLLSDARLLFTMGQLNSDLVAILIDMRKVLANRVTELIADRHSLRIGAFDLMTYVAALYSSAALRLSDHIRLMDRVSEEQLRQLEKDDQYIDEFSIYETQTYFVNLSMTRMLLELHLGKRERRAFRPPSYDLNRPYPDIMSDVLDKYAPFDLKFAAEGFAALKAYRRLRS